MSERYTGKPFLKLIDCYVLDAIGCLDEASDAALKGMEPQFRESFGEEGGWREIVAARMQFPAGMPAAIREVWAKGRIRFREAQGHEPDPGEFARVFVDTNFPH